MLEIGDRVEIVVETGYSKPYLQKGQRGTVEVVGVGSVGYYVKMDGQVQGEDPWYLGHVEIRKLVEG